MWSYDSTRNPDRRVQLVVGRSMREGLGSEEVDLRPALPDFAAVEAPRADLTLSQSPESDLISPSEGFALTMAEALPPGVSDGLGSVEALGSPMGSGVLSNGGGLELLVADLQEKSSVVSVFGGAPKMKIDDDEELLEVAEGYDLALSPPCFALSFPSSSRFTGLQGDAKEVRGRGDEVGQSSVVPAISALDGDPVMGIGGNAMFSGRLGMGLAATTSDDRVLPGHSPPSSPVEPLSERVEKDMGTHGGASGSQQVLGGV
ncbi:hypothetical protein Dimus_022477 [Dionaea muscipula]